MSHQYDDPLEIKSKLIFCDYLLNKYPKLCNQSTNSLISNLSSFKLTNGQSNEIYFLEIINQCDLIDKNDNRVVIRFYGSELTGSGNSFKMDDYKEKQIHEKVRKFFKLPRILHTFSKGRIEEFFELQNIGSEEFESLNLEISEIISRIHSLDMDDIVVKDRDHLSNVINYLFKGYIENLSNFDNLEFEDEMIKQNFKKLINFDYKKMINWILNVNMKINPKMLFSHNDLNKTNFHWLKSADHNANMKKELILIDFEYSNYGYRWADLSNYLLELTVENAVGHEKIEKFFPHDEFKSKFLANYLNNLKKINSYKFDEQDNLDHLKLEVDFGCIVINLIRLLWILSHNKLNESKFNFWETACLRFNLMKKLYSKFCTKYNSIL